MKKVDEIISNINLKDSGEVGFNEPIESFTEREQIIINKLFVTFESIFSAFKSSYSSPKAYDGAKRQWGLAFKKEKISDLNKIRLVCDECRKMESVFMLSIGKFISMYKGLDSYEKMYPMYEPSRLIESKRAQPEVVKSQMDKIKEVLK